MNSDLKINFVYVLSFHLHTLVRKSVNCIPMKSCL